VATRARHRARQRAWRRGGSACRQPANTDREGPRGVVCELHRANAVLVRSRSEREGGWRGEVHGAVHSGELGRNSGELLPWLGAESSRAVVSTGCATRRRSEEEDGGCGGAREPAMAWWPRGCCGTAVVRRREGNGGGSEGRQARGGTRGHRMARGARCRRRTTTRRLASAVAPRRCARARADGGRRGRGKLGRAACASRPKRRRRPIKAKNSFFFSK
jgi:hypothetical protein